MTRARECTGKKRHDTKDAALDHSHSLRRAGSTRNHATVYKCRFCDGWHVGHKPRRRR